MAKSYEHVHFKAEYAIEHGINEAILLSHIEYIVKLENDDYLYEGRIWYRCSINKLCELFPFMPERTIKRALGNLVDKGVLIKGNYNKVSFDRTNWYSLPSYTFGPIDDTLLAPSSSTDLAPCEQANLAPSSINEKIKEDNNKYIVQHESDDFDFESLYKKYPRKEGKTRGIKICQSKIKTQKQFDQLSKAIDNYANKITNERTDIKFIKVFSTFMNEWTDWVEYQFKQTKQSIDDWIEPDLRQSMELGNDIV